MGEPVVSVYFVTPAWRRFALSAVCFEQRRRVIAELGERGIAAQCVVIADDENLDLARAAGFEVIERNNDFLGRRFNDGIEHAARHGADWIVPIGSDSWIDAAYLHPLPDTGTIRTSRMYCAVTADRAALLSVGRPGSPKASAARGAGPYMIPRDVLPSGFRPAKDLLQRGIDSSTIEGLAPARWVFRDEGGPLQYVGFRGEPHLTSYDSLWYHWGQREERDPWAVLAERYDADLVDAAREALTPAVEAVA